MKKILTACFVIALLCAARQPALSAPATVRNLRCEYLTNPLGIDVPAPRLSWMLESDQQGYRQTAYQILAAGSPAALNQDIGDLWDSGKTLSDQSVHVAYGGASLKPRMRVYWKVRVWDQNDEPSEWSANGYWEMGRAPNSRHAKWIGVPADKQRAQKGQNPAPYFRKEFKVSRSPTKARISISGLGYYVLTINGVKVGDHVLAPGHTNYDARQSQELDDSRVKNMKTRVLYDTFDVLPYLKTGANAVGVCLGNGWYFQNDRKEDEPLSYNRPRLIAELEIDFPDGSKQTITSDATWKTAYGPIVHNGVYNGEIYDARLENSGWNTVRFDDGEWDHAAVVRPPEGTLQARMSPPDRVIKTLKPISATLTAKGDYRYDFGQLISGWSKLKVSGARGDSIKLKFSEEFGASFGQTDLYILKGGGPEEWEPRFTWHAFRYVDVINSPFSLTTDNMQGRVVNTDVDTAGTFECSNALFNKILTHYRWTQLGNMHGGIPSDCPHRERRGYTGDGQIAAQAAIYNFDMAAFYTKWLNDISDAQNHVTGYVPNTAPYQNGGGGAAWGSAYIIIPWDMYLYYGDKAVLEQHYAGMKMWIHYLEQQRDADGLIIEKNLGEWVPPAATEIPPSLVSTAYFYHDLLLMTKIAAILQKNEDASRFENAATATQKAFQKRFYHPDEHAYSIGRQGANVFALGFDLVPHDLELGVFDNLVHHIEKDAKGHFDTGMMGTPLLLDVLTRFGRADLAYTLMNQRDFPSYGYTIARGATTLWETWGGHESHSHPMFGSVCQWFYQGLAGINPDPEEPGFKHIILKPNPVRGLSFAKAAYSSMLGTIESRWRLTGDDFVLETTIPANATASVFIPAQNRRSVHAPKKNATFVNFENHVAHYRIGAGSYSFTSKNVGSLIKTPMLATPVITPSDTMIIMPDSALVRIAGDIKETEIRYTLDGNEPNETSLLYEMPFVIHASTTIKARAYLPGCGPGSVATRTINFVDAGQNGLNCDYYQGDWSGEPDFDSLELKKRISVYNIALDQVFPQAEKFALVFSGVILIYNAGDYSFFLNSNDGSRLYIDDKRVVDNYGLHGSVEKEGRISLTPGRHSIRVDYFQAGGGMCLQAFLAGPGIEKQIMPAAMLFLK